MRQSSVRFTIIRPDGEETSRLPSPEAVLSRTLNLASQASEPGTWAVREYEDEIYRVDRNETGIVSVVRP